MKRDEEVEAILKAVCEFQEYRELTPEEVKALEKIGVKRPRRMQCKDIPDRPILEFIASRDVMCNWKFGDENDVHACFPQDVPSNLLLAKMGRLIQRDLIQGCTCGCHGSFEITEKGREFLADGK